MGESAQTFQLAKKLKAAWGSNIKIEYETSANPIVKDLLKTSSKAKTNNRGYPDLIASLNDHPSLLVLAECKRDLKDHAPSSDKLSRENPKRYACSGILHYLDRVCQAGYNKKNLIGIAYTSKKVDIYGLNVNFNTFGSETANIVYLGHNLKQALQDIYSPVALDSTAHALNYNQYQLYLINVRSFIRLNESASSFQRPINLSKVEEIVQYHQNQYQRTNQIDPLGIILLAQYQNKYYILDGQHRLTAYRKLCSHNQIVFKVAFQYKVYLSQQQMAHDYLIHNSLTQTSTLQEEMAKEMRDPPDNRHKTPTSHNLQAIVEAVGQVVNHYSQTYPQMFSSSRKCMKPHLNHQLMVETLETTIKDRQLWTNNTVDEIKTKLMAKLRKINTKIGKNPPKTTKRIINKAKKYKLYLGLHGRTGWITLL